MVMRALVAVAVAGCYSPALIDGQMCSETAHCPEGLACDPNTNTCVSHIAHCTQWSDFAAPTKLANLSAQGDSLFTPWLSPDKLELWYLDAALAMSLQRSRRQPGGEFPPGEPVDPQPDDINRSNGQPVLSDDLLTLYYNDGPLHVLQRKRGSVMDGFALTSERLFPIDASDAAVTADNLEMVVAVPVLSNAADLWLSTRASVTDDWPLPTPDAFAAANDPNDDDCCATISGDGLEVIFESSRGGQSLWRTSRATPADAFGPAEKLVGQPAMAGNGSPSLSRDGTTLVFASQPDGQPVVDIVLAERTCLQSD
jgi:hypothetical protein